MDYSKSGGQRGPKGAPKHREHNAWGSDREQQGGRASKEELVERLKAAARKTDTPGDDSAPGA